MIDNNAGTWIDVYDDNLGVFADNQTIVNGVTGIVKLRDGQTAGDYTTVRIKPTSFDAWGNLTLDGIWSATNDVQVTILDSSNGDAVVSGPTPYTGPLSLAGLDPVTYPELKVKVSLTEGAVKPSITKLVVDWNPISQLLIDKLAPGSVLAGRQISYRVRYSVSFVQAEDLVIYDQLPHTDDGTMTYPVDYGQNDNLSFVTASSGGQYTATAITVKGVAIPAKSVYWDLGTKPQGATEILTFVLRSKNGTINGSAVQNTANADASNASAVVSNTTNTIITSSPKPSLNKRTGTGIYPLPGGNSTAAGTVNGFSIEAKNDYAREGRETLYQSVVWDNLSDLVGKMDPLFGGAGIPVIDISPATGTYNPSFTPPGGGTPFPAVVWDVGTMGPGAKFVGSFKVKLLDTPPLDPNGSYDNTAGFDSIRTNPLAAGLSVTWPLDQTAYGAFGKSDNQTNHFLSYVKPGGTLPYSVTVANNGLVALKDSVILDKIPAGTTFKSAWFANQLVKDTSVIYYSTTDTADANTPPAHDYTSAPADLDVSGGSDWEVYDANNPPADLTTVKWLAFYIPAVNSRYLDDTTDGWIAGAPVGAAVGSYNVDVTDDYLLPDECIDRSISNRALFDIHNKTPLEGTADVPPLVPLTGSKDTSSRVAIDKPNLVAGGGGTGVSPSALSEPGNLSYKLSVANNGRDVAPDTKVVVTWPKVHVNGNLQYLPFVGVSPASIIDFDPANGRLTLDAGTLVPGQRFNATLTVFAPSGLDFGQQLNFNMRATTDSECPVAAAGDNATAVASFFPKLSIFKNDVLDVIPTGDEIDYTITMFNTGNSPSHGTYLVDRLPDETSFIHATGPQGEHLFFSADDNLPPNFLSPFLAINKATIASMFTPGIRNDNGTPTDPSDDIWTSPFGTETQWVAWNMDLPTNSRAAFPVAQTSIVGMRLKNDLDGVGPDTIGSNAGTQIFNTAGIFSDENIQAIGNEVVTTIKEAPAIIVQKSGPLVASKGDYFGWTLDYYNRSGTPDDVTYVVDTIPAGARFVSATHTWNDVAVAGGAPADNNLKIVPTSVTPNPDGTTSVRFNISGDSAFRGDGTDLDPKEGGKITVNVQADPGLPSNSELLNRVIAVAINGEDISSSRDEHKLLIRNADLRMVKVASPPAPIEGDTVTYNVLVGNFGQREAKDVVVQDVLPAGLTFVPGSTLILTPGYTIGAPDISGQTLTWSVANGNAITKAPLDPGTIPAFSGDVIVQYRCTVDPGTTPGTSLTNSASTTTSTPEDELHPNGSDEPVRTPNPDPVIAKVGPDFVAPGERFDWTLTYFNNTRQPAENVYVIDTLPDVTADGETDVTFISEGSPAGVTAYYSSAASNAVPVFDPLDPTGSGAWSATPTTPVNHLAWNVGALAGAAAPVRLTITADAIRPNGGAPQPISAGVEMVNHASISTSNEDDGPDNNESDWTTRTPGNDLSITKSGSAEGSFPGLRPGDAITYTLKVANNGSDVTYGIEVEDTFPTNITLDDVPDNFVEVTMVDPNGNPVSAVDVNGNPITSEIPVTRVESPGGVVNWFLGTNTPADALYFRKVGILPGSSQSFEIYGKLNEDIENGTVIKNEAKVTLRNRENTDPPEIYTDNNSDDSEVTVWRPDVTVRKSVTDLETGSEDWTEAGKILEYTIEYNNLGNANADNVVISEIVPAGTTLLGVTAPIGSTVDYSPVGPLANASSFDVNLGTVSAPAGFTGVPKNLVTPFQAPIHLGNGVNGVPAGELTDSELFGWFLRPAGDVDGDGVPDVLAGYPHFGANEGGAIIWLMNDDGTVKSSVRLLNGENGIPAGSFVANDYVGYGVASLGDLDGDGVPDIALGATGDDDSGTDSGGVWIILLNADGTAKVANKLVNGLNGIPAASFLAGDSVGRYVSAIGDIDANGVADVLLGALGNDDGGSASGAGWVILLNSDGTAKSAVELANGKNGIPVGSFLASDQVGYTAASAGDVNRDGIPDIALSGHGNDEGGSAAGAVWIILLNNDGTALSAVELANGKNGVPAGSFLANDQVGLNMTTLGDLDGNGIPDLAAGARLNDDGAADSGGVWIFLLNIDGTALSAVELANGKNGVPAGSFAANDQLGNIDSPSLVSTDLDGDGISDLLVGSALRDSQTGANSDDGAVWAFLLNPNGTTKAVIEIANGSGGVPAASVRNEHFGRSLAVMDFNLDGLPDMIAGNPYNDIGGTNVGGARVFLGSRAAAMAGTSPSLLDGTNVKGGQLAIEIPVGGVMSAVELANDLNGVPNGTSGANDYLGSSVVSIGDVDGNGVPDMVASAPNDTNSDGQGGREGRTGSIYLFLMNADGTVISAHKTHLGTSAAGFTQFRNDRAGLYLAAAGDVDGDGVPDVYAGSRYASNADGSVNNGRLWLVRFNADGSRKAAAIIHTGGNQAASVHDITTADVNSDGRMDVLYNALVRDYLRLRFINANGSLGGAVNILNGSGGLPAGSFQTGQTWGQFTSNAGDIDADGVPDFVVSNHTSDDDGGTNTGSIGVMLMNANGTVKTYVTISNNSGGLPAGTLPDNGLFGYSSDALGDIDADGVPDLIVTAVNDSETGVANVGAAYILRMNNDGTVKAFTKITNGSGGLPDGSVSVGSQMGLNVSAIGDIDGDGVPDALLNSNRGHVRVLLLNADGTAKDVVLITNGQGGMPSALNTDNDQFGNQWTVSQSPIGPAGDLNNDGIPDIFVGALTNDNGAGNSGGVWSLLMNREARHFSSGTYESMMAGKNVSSWDRFVSEAEIPEGTTLTYSIGRVDDSGVCIYDVAGFTDLAGPIADDGLDISNLDPALTYCIKVDFTTTDPLITPTLSSWVATYKSPDWPSLTFRVRVDQPVANAVLPDINNNVAISTDTPETDYTNNSDDEEILVRLTDIAVTKTSDKAAALEGETISFDLNWNVNGPQSSVTTRLTDILPVGLTYVSSTPVASSIEGQTLVWELGNQDVGASGSINVTATVDAGTSGETLINTVRISNTRQETTYENNQDDSPLVVNTLANVYIEKIGPATARLGQQVAYTLTYGNNGNVAAADTVVTDLLPAGLTFVDSVPASTGGSGQTRTWNLGSLAIGATGSITVNALVGTDYVGLVGKTAINNTMVETSTGEVSIADNSDDHPLVILGEPAAIAGNVWFDKNNDQTRDSDENPIPDVLVTLTGTDVYGKTVTLTTTTGDDGSYSFTGLTPGTYTVTESQPEGYLDSVDETGTIGGTPMGNNPDPKDDVISAIPLNSGDRGVEYNFGEIRPVNLGDFVWFDANGDGIQNAGEAGIPDALVQLFDAAGNPAVDINGSLVPSQTTIGDGKYNFTNLANGDYVVRVTPPENYSATVFGGDPDNDKFNDSNGQIVPGESYVESLPVTLLAGTEPGSDGDGEDGNLSVDFGFTREVAVGNTVFIDKDGDGVMDASEGINGVTVELYEAGQTPGIDTPYRTTTTSDDGNYLFDRVHEGDFTVFIPEANFAPGGPLYQYDSLAGAGGDDTSDDHLGENGLDERVNGGVASAVISLKAGGEPTGESGSTTGPVSTLADNSVNTTIDFGFNQLRNGVIGNYVWLDENSDGLQDVGEPGLPNVSVQLKDSTGAVIATTTTDSQGGYLFTDLPAGDYFVDIVDGTIPTGMTQTPPSTNAGSDFGNQDHSGANGYPVSIGGTMPWENLTADFGYNHNPATDVNGGTNLAALGDRVWIDADQDGVQDPEEIGVSGVVLTLITAGPDGLFGTADDVDGPTQITDSNGNYLFDDLEPGAYQVRVTDSSAASHDILGAAYNQYGDPDHFAESGGVNDNLTTTPVVLAPGDVFLNADFGYDSDTAPLGSIGDTVWLDLDSDGVIDPEESGISGVTVSLIDDVNDNGIFDDGDKVIATDTTDSNGNYLFEGLPADDDKYLVLVNDSDNALDGLTQTFDSDGPLNTPNISAVELTSAVPNNLDQDFGYTPGDPRGSIGDYVWLDANSDGVQDESGAGLQGITMELLDSNGNVLATTGTDENGYYLFDQLPLGDYRVRVAPEALTVGGKLENYTNTFDPDNGITSPDSTGGIVSLTAAAPDNRDQDFGYNSVALGSIGDTVWFDTDNSGGDQATQGSEPGLAGVLVKLYQDNGDGLFDPLTDTVVGEQITDGSGNYLFTDLPLDIKYFTEVQTGSLPAYVDTISSFENISGTETTTGNSVSDATPTAAVPNVRDQDFSYPPATGATDIGFIGDTIWFDLDSSGGDQSTQGNEPGLSGVTVILRDADDREITRTTTDADGKYSFEGLPVNRDYTVEVVTSTLPEGVSGVSTHDGTDAGVDSKSMVTLTTASPSNLDQDFSYPPVIALGSIGDYVWIDTDGGNDQNESGNGVSGVIVELLDKDGKVIATTTTDDTGHYNFTDLPLDTPYSVRVANENFDPDGVLEGTSHTGTATNSPDGDTLGTVTLTDAIPVDLDQDFGYKGDGSIGNLVWLDTNADGVKDASEVGIDDVTLELYRDLNGNGVADPGEPLMQTTKTAGGGAYLFDGLPFDDYVVKVTDEEGKLGGYWKSNGTADTDDNSQADSYATKIDVATPDVLHADFGYYKDPASVGNFVWFDTNEDGIQDSGEPPVVGAEVSLTVTYPDGTVTVLKTNTDANGHYDFGNLLIDEDDNGSDGGATHVITVKPPAGFEGTQTGQGTPLTDSDDPTGTTAKPVQGSNDTTAASTDPIASYDFGLVPSRTAIGSTVWIDNGTPNGTFDTGEGVSGVPVQLYKAGQKPGIDAPFKSTITGVDGTYVFDELLKGDYIVYIPSSAFSGGLAGTSSLPGGSVDNNVDNNDDGLDTPVNGGIRSNVINLTPNAERTGEPTQGLYTGTLPDDSVNMTVDFGFKSSGALVALGSTVWIDGQGAGTSDGVFNDPSEGVDGVAVELYRANQKPGIDSPIAVTTTSGGGHYFFDQLPEGDYIVHLPSGDFSNGPLAGVTSLPGAGGDDGIDHDDNGKDAKDQGGISSSVIKLTAGGENTADDDIGYAGTLPDNSVDASVDFGFNASAGAVAVGSRIWADDGDGIFQSGEGKEGVTVQLYTSTQTPGVDQPFSSTVTGLDGAYLFDQLPVDDYIVHIPASEFASGPLAGATSVIGADSGDLDESVTGNENGLDIPVNGGISSGVINLTDGGQPSGESSQGDYTGTLADNDVNMTVDFAFIAHEPDPAIGNAVFIDKDGDGVMDPGEGINGVTVELYTADQTPGVDTPYRSTVTVADGNYLFDLLPEDEFLVYIPEKNFSPGAPLYQYQSLPGAGGDDTNDDDADENGLDQLLNGGVVSAVIVIREGGEPVNEGGSATGPTSALGDDSVNYTIDFGFYQQPPLGAIGNLVWIDENSDGYQDEGEPGLPNVQVELKDSTGTVIATTTTDSHGGYLFSDLPAGDYFVDIVDGTIPANMSQTPPSTNPESDFGNQDHSGVNGYPVTIGGTNPWENLTADFGYNHNPSTDVNGGTGKAALGDRVWIDADQDGVQDPEEIGVSGVELTLITAGPDGLFGTADDVEGATRITDLNGNYLFDDLDPGAYQVRVSDSSSASHDILGTDYQQYGDPDHFAASGGINDNLTTKPVVLAPGDVFLNADFGYDSDIAPLGSIGDTVWLDLDSDGIIDPEESGISGVTVSLIDDVNGNGIFDAGDKVIASDTTDSNGNYLFEGLPADDDKYLVWVNDTDDVLNGLTQTYDSDGPLSTPNISAIELTAAVPNNLDQDFGYTSGQPRGSIGDYVWLDANSDGVQGEPGAGLEGITMELLDHTGNVVATTKTSSDGYYLFDGLPVEDNTGTPGADYTVRVAATDLAAGGKLGNYTNTFDPDNGISSPNSTGGIVTLTATTPHDRDQDFGYVTTALGSIGDTVWFDADSSGGDQTTQGSEPGIPCVLVSLYADDGDGIFEPGTDDQLVGQKYTDTMGNYLFTDLPLGVTYFTEVDTDSLPAFVEKTSTHEETTAGETTAANNVSDSTPTAGTPNITDQDFSYPPAAGATNVGFIGDTIWFDADSSGGDQASSPNESGLQGVIVILKDNGGTEIARTTTDSEGHYAFIGLPVDASYTVEVDTSTLPHYVSRSSTHDGTDAGTDSTSQVTLTTAVPSNLDQDFSYPPASKLGSIGDYVWLDSDGGNTQNEPKAGIENVIVELLDGNGKVIKTTTTDENGQYSFTDLPLDTPYSVRIADENFKDGGVLEGTGHTGTAVNSPNGDTLPPVTLTDATPVKLDQDFGYRGSGTPGKVGNLVWLDLDADGLYEPANGETLIAGVTVDLYRDLNGNGVVDPGEPKMGSTVTGSSVVTTSGDDGNYLFEGLPTSDMGNGSGGSDYVIDVTDVDGVLAGHWHSLGTVGTTDHSQSDTYGLSVTDVAPENLTGDFGYYKDPAEVGNFVWLDDNLDGRQDAGEEGIDGAKVTLTITYPDTTVVVLHTLTGDDPSTVAVEKGWYSFGNLLLDEDYNGDGVGPEPIHEIKVESPFGYKPTLVDQTTGGTSDKDDSDAHSGVAALPVQGTQNPVQNSDPTTELTVASYDFGFIPSTKSAVYNDYLVDNATLLGLDDNTTNGNPTPGVPTIDPITGVTNPDVVDVNSNDNAALGGNTDGDVYNNLLEFALCFDPGSGAKVFPNGNPNQGFHLELNDGVLDAKFNQPTGVTDVTYVLQNSTDGQTWTDFNTITPTTGTGPVSGSSTVTHGDLIANVGNSGLLRLKVSAGSTVAVTGPVGWQMAKINDFCQTYSDPLLEPCLVTGTISGVTGQVIDLTQASGTQSLATVLSSGKNYYLEVMSGENVGHIFDIVSFTATSLTLATDTDLCALNAPYNTQLTAPANLVADMFVIREHKTLESLFPIDDVDTAAPTIEGFAFGPNASSAGVLIRYNRAGGLETYVANSPVGGTDTWIASTSGAGAPDNILPPGEGIFVHNLHGSGSFDILQYGEVRTTQLAVPLKKGYNFVAAAHPIVNQSIDGGDSASRLLNASGTPFSFNGDGARSLADQIQFWQDDTAADSASTHICYDMIFYLRNQSGSVDQWSVGGTPVPTHEEVKGLFQPTRSAMYCIQKDDILEYYIPSPISNSVN
ncbi:SdrD B-like domain-containing protein [Verrucomicrobiaceae bacterium 227]